MDTPEKWFLKRLPGLVGPGQLSLVLLALLAYHAGDVVGVGFRNWYDARPSLISPTYHDNANDFTLYVLPALWLAAFVAHVSLLRAASTALAVVAAGGLLVNQFVKAIEIGNFDVFAYNTYGQQLFLGLIIAALMVHLALRGEPALHPRSSAFALLACAAVIALYAGATVWGEHFSFGEARNWAYFAFMFIGLVTVLRHTGLWVAFTLMTVPKIMVGLISIFALEGIGFRAGALGALGNALSTLAYVVLAVLAIEFVDKRIVDVVEERKTAD